MTPRRATLLTILGLAALTLGFGLGACGGDSGSDTSTQQTVVRTQTVIRTTPTTTTPTSSGAGTEGTPGAASSDAGATGSFSSGSIFRPFASNSPWNTTITGQQVDQNSDRLIRQAQERIGIVERGNTITTQRRQNDSPLFINTKAWTVPVVDEENGVETTMVCRQIPPDCGDGRNVETLLVPADVSPKPQYDGWFTILDRREGFGYDLWRARRGGTNGDIISYQFMRKWALNGPGFQQPNSVSARGSGLPLFAGLLEPEEVRAGRIEHALAMSVPGPAQRNYVQPASATDGNGRATSLPEGARIRLRADRYEDLLRLPVCGPGRSLDADGEIRSDCVPPRTNRKAARAILTALRQYGAIIVDRSQSPTMYAKQNVDWTAPLRSTDGRYLAADGRTPLRGRLQNRRQSTPLLRGNEVQFLRLSDFEVLSLGQVLKFPPLGSTEVAAQTFTPVVP